MDEHHKNRRKQALLELVAGAFCTAKTVVLFRVRLHCSERAVCPEWSRHALDWWWAVVLRRYHGGIRWGGAGLTTFSPQPPAVRRPQDQGPAASRELRAKAASLVVEKTSHEWAGIGRLGASACVPPLPARVAIQASRGVAIGCGSSLTRCLGALSFAVHLLGHAALVLALRLRANLLPRFFWRLFDLRRTVAALLRPLRRATCVWILLLLLSSLRWVCWDCRLR